MSEELKILPNDPPEGQNIYKLLQWVSDELCDHYCKYAEKMIPEKPGEDEDMLEGLLYEQYCSKCPLMRL